MIKRRFYKFEHSDKDAASDSSSSSDSDLDAEAAVESEESEDVAVEEKDNEETHSISSGYESEDSSANEVEIDSAGVNEDEQEAFANSHFPNIRYDEMPKMKFSTPVQSESLPDGFPPCILKCKTVFKCKICPRIVCLKEETMRTHLKSKRHSRSEKLLKENRLKVMLNSDGELEEQDVDDEIPAPVTCVVKDKPKFKKQKEGPHHPKSSKTKRTRGEKKSTRDGAKKRHKDED